MAFHEIDSVADINNGHRVIIYYIECKRNDTDLNASKLYKTLEAIMSTLEKKNDDVLIVKVLSDSEQFKKFQQLYKADIKGKVTLFVVNNEGIPIISQHIFEENNISAVLLSICNSCTLNPIPALVLGVKSESKLSCTIANDLNNKKESTSSSISAESMSQTELRKVATNICTPTGSNNTTMESLPHDDTHSVGLQPSSTQLQIRLPDGSRHKQQFDKEAMLNEVWVFISTQYKLKDFDLKTYNHQNFSEDEYENTLKDLDLYPNGVVIVVPKHGVSINNNGWIGSMFHYGSYQLVSKTTKTFSYIKGLFSLFWIWVRPWLFFSNNRSIGDNNIRRNQIQPTQNSNSGQSNSQRRSKSSTAPFGNNIHTLRRNDDSDDENNRYNGNSTQQK